MTEGKTTITYDWHCERCGESKRSWDKEGLDEFIREHKCNPVLYDLVRQLETEHKYKGLIENCNGATRELARFLGCTPDLAGKILDEMEKRDIASMAHPYQEM